MGIDLQNRRGELAERWRCGWRTFLIWSPFLGLILASVWIQEYSKNLDADSRSKWFYWVPWWLALIYLAGVGVIALIRPTRGIHDKLAGVYLLPR
ncbi:MAG TPA: hypothetical protein PKD72_06230, partial [Gemmatales bacterium]|nr:hypothetical protein [Gemmatales bacterium]